MGNSLPCCNALPPYSTIAVVGLSSSGKTKLIAQLQSQLSNGVVPTSAPTLYFPRTLALQKTKICTSNGSIISFNEYPYATWSTISSLPSKVLLVVDSEDVIELPLLLARFNNVQNLNIAIVPSNPDKDIAELVALFAPELYTSVLLSFDQVCEWCTS